MIEFDSPLKEQKGNSITMTIRTRDNTIPGNPYVNVDEVRLTLKDPDGTVKLNNVLVSPVSGRTGLYQRQYQTQTTDISGDWIQTVTVTKGGAVNIKTQIAFTLYAPAA